MNYVGLGRPESFTSAVFDENGTTDWSARINARGIAGLGASDSNQEKAIVERNQICEFADTAMHSRGVKLEDIDAANPPLPDFTCHIDDQTIHVELTELIAPDLVQRAKYIQSTPKDKLNEQDAELKERAKIAGLTFLPDRYQFLDLLRKTIEEKNQKYEKRSIKIDVLLVYNEAIEFGNIDIRNWLNNFEIPELTGIRSIYFKNWNQPNSNVSPVWSLKAHPAIGKLSAS